MRVTSTWCGRCGTCSISRRADAARRGTRRCVDRGVHRASPCHLVGPGGSMNRAIFPLLAVVAACSGPKEPTETTEPPDDTDTTVVPPPDTDTDTDTDPPTDTATTPTPAIRDPKFDAVVDVLLGELDANAAAGASIAVMEGGVFTWVEGFGTAEPRVAAPITADTVFQIGSTTKQMTATLALRQVQAGLYGLDDTMPDVLPAFSLDLVPSWAPNTTVRQLLSQQAGLYD